MDIFIVQLFEIVRKTLQCSMLLSHYFDAANPHLFISSGGVSIKVFGSEL